MSRNTQTEQKQPWHINNMECSNVQDTYCQRVHPPRASHHVLYLCQRGWPLSLLGEAAAFPCLRVCVCVCVCMGKKINVTVSMTRVSMFMITAIAHHQYHVQVHTHILTTFAPCVCVCAETEKKSKKKTK